MTIIFATTNERKIEDLKNLIDNLKLNIDVKSLKDIGWNRGEIFETGSTLEENSLIKANAVYEFCKDNNILYPIITDDAGLFVESLNGEPGVYTGRYADEELKQDRTLPKHECVNKLLKKLNGISKRSAYYKCVVTCMYHDKTYFQESDVSYGKITESIKEPLKKPYFYSVFMLDGTNKTFNELKKEELDNTYRYNALKKILNRINNIK